MKRKVAVLMALLSVFVLTGWSSAAGIDDVVNNAKKEGKALMLELGSVGCIPCEQMKPVMERLRTNYRGKLEVFFVDVRKDKEAARRFGVFPYRPRFSLIKTAKSFTGIWVFTGMRRSSLF